MWRNPCTESRRSRVQVPSAPLLIRRRCCGYRRQLNAMAPCLEVESQSGRITSTPFRSVPAQSFQQQRIDVRCAVCRHRGLPAACDRAP